MNENNKLPDAMTDEFPPPGFKEMSSEESPGENFKINFIYDAQKGRFLWDLSKINQGAFGLIMPQTETN